MWVAFDPPSSNPWLRAYTLSTGARDASKDINTAEAHEGHAHGGGAPEGLWTDGTTIWVADDDDDALLAFTIATNEPDESREITLHSDNDRPRGIWSDGVFIWVVDVADNKAYAYRLADGSRVPARDYAPLHAENTVPTGIWSNGTTTWVADATDDKLYAYNAHPLSVLLRATAGKTTATKAQLELLRHTGNWYYKADTGPHAACSTTATAADAKVNLAGLTPGATYTYQAFSASGCATANLLASATFTTGAPALTASYGDTELTLTLAGWVAGTGAGQDGNWYYKADTGPHAACSTTAQSNAAVHLTGLTGGTVYTYTAYRDGNCANVIDAAPAFTTHAANTTPALAAALETTTSLRLTLSDYTGPWWYKYTVPATPAGVCTPASEATVVATGLAKNTSYTFKAYRAAGCASSRPAGHRRRRQHRPDPDRSQNPVGVGLPHPERLDSRKSWRWLLADSMPIRRRTSGTQGCRSGAINRGEEIYVPDLSTANTNYTFTAYRNIYGCSGTVIGTVTFTTLATLQPGEYDGSKSGWNSDELITGVTDPEIISDPSALWSDGTTLWVHSRSLRKLAAFQPGQ